MGPFGSTEKLSSRHCFSVNLLSLFLRERERENVLDCRKNLVLKEAYYVGSGCGDSTERGPLETLTEED